MSFCDAATHSRVPGSTSPDYHHTPHDVCLSDSRLRQTQVFGQLLSSLHAILRPDFLPLVILLLDWQVIAKHHPRLLRRSEYVNVWWSCRRIVQCAYSDVSNNVSGVTIVAPDHHLTLRTMVHLLISATCGWYWNRYRLLGGEKLDKFRLNHRIERKRGSAFFLAECTVTAVYDERASLEAIADRAARAASFCSGPVMWSGHAWSLMKLM